MKFCVITLLALLPAMAAMNDINKNKTVGNPDAPVTLTVYSDFECPSCKQFHERVIPMLLQEYVTPGKVFLVYREFPLTMHKYSREAANYATAAARFGFYQPVADALFRDQGLWSVSGKVWNSVANVLSPAQQKKVQAMAADPSVAAEVQRDLNAGATVPVQSTPTLLVTRGTRRYPISGSLNYILLKKLLDDVAK